MIFELVAISGITVRNVMTMIVIAIALFICWGIRRLQLRLKPLLLAVLLWLCQLSSSSKNSPSYDAADSAVAFEIFFKRKWGKSNTQMLADARANW